MTNDDFIRMHGLKSLIICHRQPWRICQCVRQHFHFSPAVHKDFKTKVSGVAITILMNDFFHPWEQLAAMQPSRQLLPPNDDENSHFNASSSRDLYAPVTMTQMPAPPQPSWPENSSGHISMQFSVSESGPGSGQQLPTNIDSEPGPYNANYSSFNPESYDAGLQMTSMPHLPPQHPQNLDPRPSQYGDGHASMQLPTNIDSEPGPYNANYSSFDPKSYYAGLQMTSMPHLPPQHPQNLDAPAIGAMYNQSGPSQFQASIFTNASMPLQLHHQSPDTPAFGAVYNDVMNPGIAPSSLHYCPSPNIGSFYPNSSEPVMLKGKDVALPPGIDHEPQQYQQGSKVQVINKFREYHWPPKKRGKVAMGRVEKSSLRSQTSSLAPSTALPITASAPPTSTYHWDLVYDKNNTKHQRIVDSAKHAIIRDAINENCLTDPSARSQLVLQELKGAAISEYKDEAFRNNWAAVNSETLFTNLSAPYESIMETSQHIARNIVQLGYHLRPPAWAATAKPEYQADMVAMLIDDTIVFPPRFVFSEDEDTHELHFLENVVVWNVLLNNIVELDLYPHTHNLDKMFCAAAAAVKCALMELRTGTFMEIDFTFQGFRHIYNDLLNHIGEYISLNPELLKRWDEYKQYTLTGWRIRRVLVPLKKSIQYGTLQLEFESQKRLLACGPPGCISSTELHEALRRLNVQVYWMISKNTQQRERGDPQLKARRPLPHNAGDGMWEQKPPQSQMALIPVTIISTYLEDAQDQDNV
ncbi:hypothetical protein EV702DRAFT_1047348 [Suillus placidus]|uniref:DUF6532 domain-containing protein n=1 Tax=Suillus placidus TaxID=48579 RepID=A0A9P6ZRB4_9AGAM|nr:hypothetical protein EV702DRAFT_1047348 [Suillus placidus]